MNCLPGRSVVEFEDRYGVCQCPGDVRYVGVRCLVASGRGVCVECYCGWS